ncbi:diadenylate cyclase CdaA [Treponema brennaborense]|uniref:Diadenylate cyclase n=1 Tax=Treponema brennaborense (strain DSM 12168 / CIP 105900 / DD5/3) TaxID=906968 RepID=F4LKZ6_TREBD|nr:diadenylate cyclase CdaA [Treponema brennaborense]AEE16593.1 Conserved hypothetical protein CHP00159 [Treponema brennaborense DSM 12168]
MNTFNIFQNAYNYIRPVLDVGVLTLVLYKAYEVFVKTNGMHLIKAGIMLAVAYAAAVILDLSALLWLLNIVAPSLLVGFAIVFQPELRKVFLKLGQGEWFAFGHRSRHTYVDSVLIAAETLSNQRRGMLAVFVRHTGLKDIIETGQRLNADLSSSLLVTIFGHDTPMHDGAVIIQGGKVLAAGCFLPLSEQYDIKKTFGTRHRAALGVSEETDALVLVVSEESGAISLAYDSKLYYDLTMEQLTKTLESQLEITPDDITQEDDSHENQAVL